MPAGKKSKKQAAAEQKKVVEAAPAPAAAEAQADEFADVWEDKPAEPETKKRAKAEEETVEDAEEEMPAAKKAKTEAAAESGSCEADPAKKKRKPKNQVYSCFVCNIPWSWDEKELQKIVESYGCKNIISVRIQREQFTNRSRGIGFVDFSTSEDADTCVRECNGLSFEGRDIKVEFSTNNPKAAKKEESTEVSCFVSNLPWSWDEVALRKHFTELGCKNITTTSIRRQGRTGSSRGIGFVNFATRADADECVKKADGATFEDRKLKVEISNGSKKKQEKSFKNVDPASKFSVWVGNFPYDASPESIRQEFESHGCSDILLVRFIYDRTGFPQGFGFVDFANVQAAKKAAHVMNGLVVGKRDLNVKLADYTK